MANILISGDSWGGGERAVSRKGEPKRYLHSGTEQYLKDAGHTVVNVSVPGCANRTSVNNIFKALETEKFDYVFWFQTDPLRDLSPNYYHISHIAYTVQDLVDLGNKLLTKTYNRLNQSTVPVHCIGGLGKLNVDLMAPHKNLVPLIPCVVELVIENYYRYPLSFSDWINESISKDFKEFDELIRIKKEYDKWYEEEPFKTYFYPDGLHANRLAHKKIFEVIQEKVLTKNQ